jgi:hypothetical protein
MPKSALGIIDVVARPSSHTVATNAGDGPSNSAAVRIARAAAGDPS